MFAQIADSWSLRSFTLVINLKRLTKLESFGWSFKLVKVCYFSKQNRSSGWKSMYVRMCYSRLSSIFSSFTQAHFSLTKRSFQSQKKAVEATILVSHLSLSYILLFLKKSFAMFFMLKLKIWCAQTLNIQRLKQFSII